mmetsp:Transcript_35683/g.85169  ORF Transcript_35683/g.85169 Transcript_35683/m.85169 type:complete len:230 (-) Transcript_35683:191-880(-)
MSCLKRPTPGGGQRQGCEATTDHHIGAGVAASATLRADKGSHTPRRGSGEAVTRWQLESQTPPIAPLRRGTLILQPPVCAAAAGAAGAPRRQPTRKVLPQPAPLRPARLAPEAAKQELGQSLGRLHDSSSECHEPSQHMGSESAGRRWRSRERDRILNGPVSCRALVHRPLPVQPSHESGDSGIQRVLDQHVLRRDQLPEVGWLEGQRSAPSLVEVLKRDPQSPISTAH